MDGAIHRAAGPKLQEQCKSLGGCQTGKAKLTKGYNLKAKYVIHTVGPVWHGGTHQEAALLASCYRESMKLTREQNIETIAFPAISCGVYGYPVQSAAQIAITTLIDCLEENQSLKQISLVCFGNEVFSAYNEYFKQLETSP